MKYYYTYYTNDGITRYPLIDDSILSNNYALLQFLGLSPFRLEIKRYNNVILLIESNTKKQIGFLRKLTKETNKNDNELENLINACN